jgi:hypothetical protein
MRALVVGSDYFAERFLYHLKRQGVSADKSAKLPAVMNYDAAFFSGSSCRAENIFRALEEGLDVFSEQIVFSGKKDLGITDYARMRGLRLYLGAFDIFNPVVREIRESLKSQDVKRVRIDRVGPVSHSNVNIVEDSLLHSIGTLMYILGRSERPKIVSCMSDNLHAECTLTLDVGGVKGVLYSCNQNVYKERIIDVFCRSMRLRGDTTKQELLILDGKGSNADLCMAGFWSFRRKYITKTEPLSSIIRDFLGDGRPPVAYSFLKNMIMATFGAKNILEGGKCSPDK